MFTANQEANRLKFRNQEEIQATQERLIQAAKDLVRATTQNNDFSQGEEANPPGQG